MVSFTCVFVTLTLIFTLLSSVLLTLSLLSNYWEYVSYDEEKIENVAKAKNHTVVRITEKLIRLDMTKGLKQNISSSEEPQNVGYLFPANGGVNALCADITEEDRQKLKHDGFFVKSCISYLSNDDIVSMDAWLDRMRNLAMSCSIVCLILLGSSAPLGILGITKKQISTIMVTGVMYILAAVFGIFTLAFMYFKRSKPEGYYTNTILDRIVPEDYLKARHFAVGWPSSMGWAGLSVCLVASIFWLVLAKIMRFQVLSPT